MYFIIDIESRLFDTPISHDIQKYLIRLHIKRKDGTFYLPLLGFVFSLSQRVPYYIIEAMADQKTAALLM
jgi:hypothetical protein